MEETKNTFQKILDWMFPIGLVFFYFFFYSTGKTSPSEMIKLTGLVAIALLSITLIIGSLSRFLPAANILKMHRKHWGIASFVFALIHAILVIVYYFDYDILRLFDISRIGTQAGLIALLILFIVFLSSFRIVFEKLPEGVWKKLQTTSYIALALVVIHFFLMEQQDGVFVIKRILGKITYWFALITLIARVIVAIFPKKEINAP